jgi:cytochrome c-type biogenesis protein CcmH/NrfG
MMNRRLGILIFSAALLARAAHADEKLIEAGIAEFTAAHQAWDGARFAAASNLFRQASASSKATATHLYWLGASEFHRMLQLRGDPANSADADAALDSALEALTAAVALDEKSAESHALLGTLYGMKINGSLFGGPRFGPRVAKHLASALTHGEANPRVQYLLGTSQFHTAEKPAEMQIALQTLLKAKELFEAEARTAAAPLAPRWGHDSCLTFIGRAYENLGKPEEAAASFRSALQLHPRNSVAQAGFKRVTEKK